MDSPRKASLIRRFPVAPCDGLPVALADLDGDGRDELFIGYSLLDHELRPLWSLNFRQSFDYEKDHADEIALSDLAGDGLDEILVVSRQQVCLFASPETEPFNTPVPQPRRTRGS